MKIFNKKGFTILEVSVSVSLFALAVVLVGSMYTVSQRAYNSGSDQGELSQNIRVSLDRISRELRQSKEIITAMPNDGDDSGNPPVNEIFFQDGHDMNEISYIRYYLNNSDLMRSHIAYYFSVLPDEYVRWDSVDESGDSPEVIVLENRIVAEYFNKLQFYGENGLVHISVGVNKNDFVLDIDTSVYSRNW
jgi:prepilin-type N-terminal cleavage/methylation domain-containing protein